MKVKRALISVTDKRDLVPFVKGLRRLGVEIVSTGGTLALLKQNKIKAKSIGELTGFPEIFDGRLKTLHPKVHGGLLMVRGDRSQRRDAKKYGIEPIDLVVVNLYRFTDAVSGKNVSDAKAIEHIDIGGPTMLRSAAKNFEYVGVVSSPDDYAAVLSELRAKKGSLSRGTRRRLAAKVFSLTQRYDRAISDYFSRTGGRNGESGRSKELPDDVTLAFEKIQTLRYGENPHQRAAYYKAAADTQASFRQLQGKELSFNNLLDIESALEIVQEFSGPAVVVVKHNNSCGVAEAKNLRLAAIDAIECDAMSAFGGIISVNRRLTVEAARAISERLPFFEVLIAPAYDRGALNVFKSRKNLRLIETDPASFRRAFTIRVGSAGVLLQDYDGPLRGREKELRRRLTCATEVKPSREDMASLIFAWKCAKHVRSNAIVLASGRKTVGIGAGQMSRIDAVRIACAKAGEKAHGAVLASDGFFPMPDNIETAHQNGIRMIIQPGGSIRDKDVVDACNRFGIGMVLTGQRHFRH